MWFCAKCRNELEDKYSHCWQCGTKRVVGVKPRQQPAEVTAVPTFTSYEEMEKPAPLFVRLLLRRNPLQRPIALVIMLILVKVFGSPFMGKYGLYIFIGVAVMGLLFILWGYFRRDPNEGVGVKLN